MLFVYFFLVAAFGFFFLRTRNYKKNETKDLMFREHPLKVFYGMLMFLEDRIFKNIGFLENDKSQEAIRKIWISDKTESIEYLYKIKRSALAAGVLSVFLLIGLCKSIEGALPQSRFIKTLPRPEYGMGSSQVDLNIRKGKETEKISLEIEEYRYSLEESEAIIAGAYKKLLVLMRGENAGLDEVTTDLSLVSYVDDVKVSWQIENMELVDFNGRPYRENAKGDGSLTHLTAVLEFQDAKKNYEIPIVIKAESEKEGTIQNKIQQAINESGKLKRYEIELPEEVEGMQIKYLRNPDNEEAVILIIGVLAAVGVVLAKDREMKRRLKLRNIQMMRDYPEIVTKLALLNEAGLSIKSSWSRVVEEYEINKKTDIRYAYEEMRLTNQKMRNGVSEPEAYAAFGARCGLQPYLKLGTLLEQNVMKGSKGLMILLEQEAESAFEERKNQAKVRGAEAGTKLLLPMMMMLIIVIVIIAVPAFMTMGI